MTFKDVVDIEEGWREKKRKMDDLARTAGCVPVKETQLVAGDRFRLFYNGGAEDWRKLMGIAPTVYVWESCDGIGYGHEEVSGRKATFTGEDWVAVVKSNALIHAMRKPIEFPQEWLDHMLKLVKCLGGYFHTYPEMDASNRMLHEMCIVLQGRGLLKSTVHSPEHFSWDSHV